MFYFRVPFFDVVILSSDWTPLVTVLWLLGMTQAINLIDGLDGLAAGIVAIAATSFFLYANKLNDLELLPEPQPRPADRDHHRRRVRRVPAVQLQPGPDLHGRQRGVPARHAARRLDERRRWPCRSEHTGLRRPDVLLLRPAGDPAADPRRADPRHAVRDRAPAVEAPGDRRRRQGPSPPPVDEPRPRPSPFGADPVGVDGAAVGASCCIRCCPTRTRATSRSASAPSASCSTPSCTRASAASGRWRWRLRSTARRRSRSIRRGPSGARRRTVQHAASELPEEGVVE